MGGWVAGWLVGSFKNTANSAQALLKLGLWAELGKKYFGESTILMGDFNLSHRVREDRMKILEICQETKVNFLKEITRSTNNNQLDYILVDEKLKDMCYATSYHNFISDHKSIVVRVGLNGNKFTDEMRETLTFDRDSHLKEKAETERLSNNSSEQDSSTPEHSDLREKNSSPSGLGPPPPAPSSDFVFFDLERSGPESEDSLTGDNQSNENQIFRRRFDNPEGTSCWLNSCLQLILNAMDHSVSTEEFNSELGKELKKMQSNKSNLSLDSTNAKYILVTTEDMRIATRLSELEDEIDNPVQLQHRIQNIQDLRLDFLSGQQCVRDFFICLKENVLNWPDVFSWFGFNITHSTECIGCNSIHRFETIQTYIELEVPPNGQSLHHSIEEYFNTSELRGSFCEADCQKFTEVEKRSTLLKSVNPNC